MTFVVLGAPAKDPPFPKTESFYLGRGVTDPDNKAKNEDRSGKLFVKRELNFLRR